MPLKLAVLHSQQAGQLNGGEDKEFINERIDALVHDALMAGDVSVSLLPSHVGQPRQLLFPLGNKSGQLGRRFLLLQVLRAQRLHLRCDGAAVLLQQLTKARPVKGKKIIGTSDSKVKARGFARSDDSK